MLQNQKYSLKIKRGIKKKSGTLQIMRAKSALIGCNEISGFKSDFVKKVFTKNLFKLIALAQELSSWFNFQ